MKQIVLVVIGLAAALAGLVWTLQGLGYVGGSFMSGATVWAVIGPIVALAGPGTPGSGTAGTEVASDLISATNSASFSISRPIGAELLANGGAGMLASAGPRRHAR